MSRKVKSSLIVAGIFVLGVCSAYFLNGQLYKCVESILNVIGV